jgi:hypothetical protein
MSEQMEPQVPPAPEAQPAPQPAPHPTPPAKAALGVISFGLALGVTFGISVFLLGLASALFDWGTPVVAVLSSLYIGYSPSFVGSIAGAVWAFVDGFIAGALTAWLYNRFVHARR